MPKQTIYNVQTGETTVVEDTATYPQISNETALTRLRSRRGKLLRETDHLALSDNTLSDEMKQYRKDLRDLPANTSDPKNPTWPTKPSA